MCAVDQQPIIPMTVIRHVHVCRGPKLICQVVHCCWSSDVQHAASFVDVC